MIRRWLPSSSTKRRISDFLKHRTSLHDTAARQQLTVNCSSRGYARMIEAHADPRSEALWAGGPKRGGGAQKTDATRRERELRGELVRCKIVPYVEPVAARPARACAPGPSRFGARHRHGGTGPARHRVPACGPRSQEQEDDPVEVLYMPTPVPKYTALTLRTRPLTCHTLNTQHFTDWTDNTPQCACAAPRPPMHEPLPVPPSPTVSSARVRARLHAPAPWRPGAEALALHNEAQGQGHNAHGTRLTRALWNSVP